MHRFILSLLVLSILLVACGSSSTSMKHAEGIEVSTPAANSIVTSPLTIEGKATGNWFFEASLPILLVNEDGEIIQESYGTAKGEWMTPNFVPFSAELSFETTASKGYLLVRKDNPSGLPENDAEFRIPVRFQ